MRKSSQSESQTDLNEILSIEQNEGTAKHKKRLRQDKELDESSFKKKNKLQRKDDHSDISYSRLDYEKLDNEDDEVDIVDINGIPTSPLSDSENYKKSLDKKKKANKNSKVLNLIRNRSKNQKIIAKHKKEGIDHKKKMQKKPTEKASQNSSEEDEEDKENDEINEKPNPHYVHQAQSAFWPSLHPYLRYITEDDLVYLMPRQIKPNDSAFIIPPPGSQSDTNEHKHKVTTANGSIDEDIDGLTDIACCGDLTSRILSALIEEKLLLSTQDINTFDKNEIDEIPYGQPPTSDYSPSNMANLEDRIKLELKSIGLFEEVNPIEPIITESKPATEDDEICNELKSLQTKLKEQIQQNNDNLSKLYSLAIKRMAEQEQEREEKAVTYELERTYLKHKKKPRRKKVVTRSKA